MITDKINYDADLVNKICKCLTDFNMVITNDIGILNCTLQISCDNSNVIIIYKNNYVEIVGYIYFRYCIDSSSFNYEDITNHFLELNKKIDDTTTKLDKVCEKIFILENELNNLKQDKISLKENGDELKEMRENMIKKFKK